MEKMCNNCNQLISLNDFHKLSKNDDCDRYRSICKKCHNEKSKIYRDNNKEKIKKSKKKWRDENIDYVLEKDRLYRDSLSDYDKLKRSEYNKKWQEDNKESQSIKKKKYYQENRDTFLLKSKIYQKENKEDIKKYRESYKEYRNLKRKERLKNDTIFLIEKIIRNSIYNAFKSSGYSKKSRTHEIIGCSFDELKLYIESKFQDWMTWENRGLYNGELNYGWDIDHIIPLSSAETEEDIIRLNHYTNLQPLCSYTNRYIKRNYINI